MKSSVFFQLEFDIFFQAVCLPLIFLDELEGILHDQLGQIIGFVIILQLQCHWDFIFCPCNGKCMTCNM